MNVRFDKSCAPFVLYEKLLIDRVQRIVKRLEYDFSDVEWVIYDNNNPPCPILFDNQLGINSNSKLKNNIGMDIFKPKDGTYYGFCNAHKKTIYISTAAIQTCPILECPATIPPQLIKNDNLGISQLTSVIIDELAHISTCKDHGSPLYESTLASYRRKCADL